MAPVLISCAPTRHDEEWRCPRCGFATIGLPFVGRTCPAQNPPGALLEIHPPAPPSELPAIQRDVPLARRALHFARALYRHAKNPEYRQEHEIEQIFDTHCRHCPYFAGEACQHPDCGCHVSREQRFLNKLAWRSEHCPDSPPRW